MVYVADVHFQLCSHISCACGSCTVRQETSICRQILDKGRQDGRVPLNTLMTHAGCTKVMHRKFFRELQTVSVSSLHRVVVS